MVTDPPLDRPGALPARPIVETRDLTIHPGRTSGAPSLITDTSFSVFAGEIVGIQGASGCGKSTLLRVLAGLTPASHGNVLLGGELVRGPRRDGYVMPINQDSHGSLNPRWPIWRSITEPLLAAHRRPAPRRGDRRALAQQRLATINLGGLDPDARPSELSGGQRQRIAILRALLAAPALLLADEPTAALDVSVSAGVLRLLHESALGGVAIVVASHDSSSLEVLCDRILAFDGPRLVERKAQRPTSDATPRLDELVFDRRSA